MTRKTTIMTSLILASVLMFALPGIGNAFAVKTYALYQFEPTDDFRGVSVYYSVDDRVRTGALNDTVWFRTTVLGTFVEIGWQDLGGTHQVQYYCGEDGDIEKKWGSPADGVHTTYYIYDPQNDDDFDLIGGLDSCQFTKTGYTSYKLEVGFEDHQDSNVLQDEIHEDLKWYDGTWHLWDLSDGTDNEIETHNDAVVVICTAEYDINIGDTASSC